MMFKKKPGDKGKKTSKTETTGPKTTWVETSSGVSEAEYIARLRHKVRLVRDVEDEHQRRAETKRRILDASRKRPVPPIRTVGSQEHLNSSERTIARLIAKETKLPLRGIVTTIQTQPEIAKKRWHNFF